MKKLKERWNIDSDWQLFVIFLAFAITGSTSAKFSGPIMESLGFGWESTRWYIYMPIYVMVLTPLYQIILVIVGWIYGETNFFWNFEKKMLRRLGLGFLIKNES
ncbi:diacylglyceryl transferase [Aureitalea sp. L0-47]|uniref:DUF6787 family protein n=1 Tax=Aureitalea sp. L0-47 TaxID=2816962 RepID=UPI002238F60C|nr:DUF6787 family protein [Aureitalea sp. L0-47]MCW5520543.1 diacylglyceryl transferase [Aureitalea sp. L0-47]